MRRCLLFLIPLVVASAVFATTPPPLPLVLPPQTPEGPVILAPPDRVLPAPPPFNKERLDELNVSGSLYRAMLEYLVSHGMVPGMNINSVPGLSPDESRVPGHGAGRVATTAFWPAPLLSVSAVDQVDSDGNEDTEPTTIVQKYPAGGTDYQITAYMKFATPNNGTAVDYVRSTVDNLNKALAFAPAPPSGYAYDHMADPVLAENPYNSGVNPKRLYCIGTMYNFYTSGPNTGLVADTTIPMWYTDNAGSTWSNPYPIKSLNRGTYVLLDKPAIAVSWNQNSLGVVYAAFVEVPTTGGMAPDIIDVYRLNQNGTSFQYRSQPVSGINIQAPQLVVDPNDGTLYLLWADFPNGTINVARSSDQGGSFPTRYSFSAPNMISNIGYGDLLCDNSINHTNCVQARTTPTAVWNNYDLSVGVVWHARETTDRYAHSNINFNRFRAYGTPPAWDTTKTVNFTTTNDQWHAALDVNENGQYTVAYYDRRNDANNIKYQTFGTKIDAAGNRLPTSTTDDTLLYETGILSNLLAYTAIFGTGGASRSVGEYQGMWYWYGTWYGATVYIPSTTGDIYNLHISP